MVNWTLKTIPIKKLSDHYKNPRQITKEQLKHLTYLIKTFNLIEKPIVNLDMTIIGGHQRIKIIKKMKVKEVACWIPDRILSQEEIDHLCIGLNLNQGSFDYDILADQWELLDLLKYGFTENQLLDFHKETADENDDSEKKTKLKTCPSCGHEF